ncbi:hypothetical protein ABK040_013828 [Willaertia magna]
MTSTNKNFKTQVLSLKGKSENKYCADCLATETAWASTNLGVFVCINCSGVHRSLGTHVSKVKSVELDDWTEPEQYEIMSKVGNIEANSYWECNTFPFEKPLAHDKYAFRKRFIVDKYVKKKFLPSPENVDYKLEREFDVKLVSRQGFVTKQGFKRKTWKKRYMVLHEDVLSYFKNQSDSYPAGSIKIELDSLVMFVDELQLGKKNCFAIVTKTRNYYMYCDLEEEVCDWIYSLRAAVYYANLKRVFNDPRNFLKNSDAKRVERKGILKKQGGNFKSVKKRYFVLKDSQLSYYKSEKEMEPIDSIDLRNTKVETTKNTKCGITLHTVGRQYFFLAENEKEKDEWINAIDTVTKAFNEGELIQKKSIAIHQLILNKIKEEKDNSASENQEEQVSPHSPMMWKSLSFHRCRKSFLDKLLTNPKDGNIEPVERLKNSPNFMTGGNSTANLSASTVSIGGSMSTIVLNDSVDATKRFSLFNISEIAQQQNINDESNFSFLKRASFSIQQNATQHKLNVEDSTTSLASPSTSSSSLSPGIGISLANYSNSSSNLQDEAVTIDEIKIEKMKQKKNKKDKFIPEHDVSDQIEDKAMESMMKGTVVLKRTSTCESDDLDDLGSLINDSENAKLKYESDEEVPTIEEVTPPPTTSKKIVTNDYDSGDSEECILDDEDIQITSNNVLAATTTTAPVITKPIVLEGNGMGKIILQSGDSSDDDEIDEDDNDDGIEMNISVKRTPTNVQLAQASPVTTVRGGIKTRNSVKRVDKTKKKNKKTQSVFRRMHSIVEEELQSIGIDVE